MIFAIWQLVLLNIACVLIVVLGFLLCERWDRGDNFEVWGKGRILDLRAEVRRIKLDPRDPDLYRDLQYYYPDLSGLLSQEGLVNYHLDQLFREIRELKDQT